MSEKSEPAGGNRRPGARRAVLVSTLSLTLFVVAALTGAGSATAAPAPDGPSSSSRQTVVMDVPLVAVGSDGRVHPHQVSPAGCHFQYVTNAHMSARIPNAAKVNSKIQCNRPVEALYDTTNLYRWIAFGLFPWRERSTSTVAFGKAFLLNEQTYKNCTNSNSNQWFGDAYGRSVEGGVTYEGYAASPNVRVSLPCGT